MLKYETDLKVSDVDALRKEANEVLVFFRKAIENEQYRQAVMSANEKPGGLVLKSSKGYNFVYEKRTDEQWHCLDDDKHK